MKNPASTPTSAQAARIARGAFALLFEERDADRLVATLDEVLA